MSMTLSVPGVHCEHCRRAIAEEVSGVQGVASVDVDVDRKQVRLEGEVESGAVVAAIERAGYEVDEAA